jgi:hypothetical protein
MMEHRRVRVTLDPTRDQSASSTDESRELTDAEVAAIGAWLEGHRANTPSSAAELRATEEVMAGGYSGRRAV